MWERTKDCLLFPACTARRGVDSEPRRIVLLSAAIPPARHSALEKSLLMSDNQGEFSKSCHFQMMVYILCGGRGGGFFSPFSRGGARVGGSRHRGPCTVKERHLMATDGTVSSTLLPGAPREERGWVCGRETLMTAVSALYDLLCL